MTLESPPESFDGIGEAGRDQIAEHSGWYLALGIALIGLGAVSVIFPFVTTVAAEILFGALFVLGGILRLAHAFRAKRWSGFLLALVIGILFTVFGILLVAQPIAGIFSLTFLLIGLFLADGILEIIMAFRLKPASGWGWLLATGLVSLVIGALVWLQLPSSALWALGLLIGIALISHGCSIAMLALRAR